MDFWFLRFRPRPVAPFSRSARSARKASEICLRASEKTAGESLTGLHPEAAVGIAECQDAIYY